MCQARWSHSRGPGWPLWIEGGERAQPRCQGLRAEEGDRAVGSTQALFEPIEAGNLARVAELLDEDPGLVYARSVDPHPQRAGQSPLQAAAVAGHLDVVRLLIDRGAEVYAPAQHGYPAVCHAAWAEQQQVVDAFLGEWAERADGTWGVGIDVNLAARLGWREVVGTHLARDPLAVHRRGVIGETPLHWAAHDGHTEIVRDLLNAGADIEADEIGAYGGKPLHWAAEHEPQVVRLLLARGAQVDSRNLKEGDLQGCTPLLMCALQRNDCAECADLLLAAGADAGAKDAKGRTALSVAEMRGHSRVAGLLRSRGGR